MNNKSAKNAAIILIVFPLIIFIGYFGKIGVGKYGLNDYVIMGSLIVLTICGIVALRNSLSKQSK